MPLLYVYGVAMLILETIEIENTDAEGRLTLADAVEYAKQNGAKQIIDVATLTGAVIMALGHGLIGAFGNDKKLLSYADVLINISLRKNNTDRQFLISGKSNKGNQVLSDLKQQIE